MDTLKKKNGNKYLIIDPTGKNKKIFIKIHKTFVWN